ALWAGSTIDLLSSAADRAAPAIKYRDSMDSPPISVFQREHQLSLGPAWRFVPFWARTGGRPGGPHSEDALNEFTETLLRLRRGPAG
ncbi:MAG TPA: hypothetical protein VKJ45_02670, partial [Blastocatellia bacterium]|nr:hypothetical protein [Blastocatellia bacterium]